MTPEIRKRVAEIVDRALEAEPGQRGQLIVDLCGDDQKLFVEVASLLQFEEKAREFIERPAVETVAEILASERCGLQPGDALNGYKIVSLIGEGGMGEVYLADDTSLGRKVAIKLLKPGMGTVSIIRHFHEEERILAGLTHQNIAQLYGGAVTKNGLPYFVMEYVDGKRLDYYCRAKASPLRERLELFRKICSAVAYAHQRLIIHRDIKPANIRVTVEGEPKLLDFGIAKLLEPGTVAIEQTMTLGAVMTPEYASPEQIRGETMTTASDVYSLGVVLYELLTEQKPYKIDNRTPAAVARAITDQEPTKPSTFIARSDGSSNSQIPTPKQLRGDLDNIVLMAMRKEPARRYASVAQFSEDIRRYLEDRPVIARADALGYRASKFVARNKIAVAASALILLSIIAGSIAALWQAEIARRQRDVAERERLKSERINTFLQDMLGAAKPETKGKDVKVADILKDASQRAKIDSERQPELMADVLLTLGRTYISLGVNSAAEENLRAALAASLKANGEQHSTTTKVMAWLALALSYQNKPQEGIDIAQRALEIQRKLDPRAHETIGVASYSLGLNLLTKGDNKAAVAPLEEAVAEVRQVPGREEALMAALTHLGLVRQNTGDAAGAEQLYRQALALGANGEPRFRVFIAQASGYLGWLLINKEKFDEAEKMLRESEKIYRQVMGESNYSVGVTQANLGLLHFLQGKYPEAEKEQRAALVMLQKHLAPDYPITLNTTASLGLTLTRLGKPTEGERLLREVLQKRKKTLPAGDVMIAYAESALGECLRAQKRFAEAEPLLLSGYNVMKGKIDNGDWRFVYAREQVLKLYEDWGKPEAAEHFR